MGLEALLGEMLGEVQVVAGEGIDRVCADQAHHPVVAMLESPDAVRVVGEDGMRPIHAHGAHDVPAELPAVLEPAVGIAEHHHVLHAHEVCGGALLRRPPFGELSGRQRAVVGARAAVGAQDIGDLAAGGHPLGYHAPGAELRVVGVGEDHHGPVGNVGHDLQGPLRDLAPALGR